jgi:hypothetical protein
MIMISLCISTVEVSVSGAFMLGWRVQVVESLRGP